MELKRETNQIIVEAPKSLKKITGTRFASILGFNKWSTPFEAWCEITRTYEKPFEDTPYTIAGKTIEPLQHDYLRKSYGLGSNLVSPEQLYGKDYFSKTYGDFFHDKEVFGGMWDALLLDNGKVDAVIEFKTTKRVEDWADDLPDYYGLQASLYAYLLGVEKVIMCASFLDEIDYTNPSAYVPSTNNTIIKTFNVHERYPRFDEYIQRALDIYHSNCELGISLPYDDEKDKEILKVLLTKVIDPNDIESLLQQYTTLKYDLEAVYESVADKEKQFKVVGDSIKKFMAKSMDENTNTINIESYGLSFNLDKSYRTTVNQKLLEKDNLLEKYTETKEVLTLRVKELKEQ